MCSRGYTVSGSKTNTFWASDMMHRLFHLPVVSEGLVGHLADGYEESLELAKRGDGSAVANTDSLQYFALEVYSQSFGGCLGRKKAASTTTTASAVVKPTETAAAKDCHTHADGTEHCV